MEHFGLTGEEPQRLMRTEDVDLDGRLELVVQMAYHFEDCVTMGESWSLMVVDPDDLSTRFLVKYEQIRPGRAAIAFRDMNDDGRPDLVVRTATFYADCPTDQQGWPILPIPQAQEERGCDHSTMMREAFLYDAALDTYVQAARFHVFLSGHED